MNTKRLSALLLAAGIIASMAACSSDAPSSDNSADNGGEAVSTAAVTEAATEEVSYYPDIDGVDYGGSDFNLIYFSNELSHGWTDIPTDMNPTEETGDILNDAVYNRNRTVEDLVNIVINEYPTKGQDGVRTAVSTDVMSGDGQYDLCFQSIVGIIGLADNGLLRDLNKVGINTDAPWYDKLSIEEMTIDGKLFYVNSDISYIDKLATIVVFFNKAIAENYNMDDFYERVRGGTWTYDYMLECSEGMSDDLNGDGVLDAEDAYGIACQNDGSYYLLHSTGNKFGEKTADGLRFAAGDEAVVSALQDVMDLMQTDLYFNSQKFGVSIPEAIKKFTENKYLFMIRPLQSVFNMRDMEADFGIIPMPKYYEDDDSYHSPMNIYPGIIMCAPMQSDNTDSLATVIDLLAAESHESVMPVFYDTVLDSKLTRDDTTAEMLDIVFGSRMYDLALTWDFGGIRTSIVTNKPVNVASLVASIESAAETEIEELFKVLAEVEG